MIDEDQLELEREELAEVNERNFISRFFYYAKRSGPGWLQGAITLGGGSLAGALYLGVIVGYDMMWVQPLAMICGVIMLLAIAYVTLSTGERPFGLINENISPVLGWSWLIATVMANVVWCMPQFNLGYAAIEQNLMPSVVDGNAAKWTICGIFFTIALIVNFFYGSGGSGIKVFEFILKLMVAVVVISFFLVVIVLAAKGELPWAEIAKGFIPDFGAIFKPSDSFTEMIASSSDADFWTKKIADGQRDKIIAAFATAVGINMTFLLPYSLLRKGWGKEHRPMAKVDLSIGLIVPFVLATGCVLLASASQFHASSGDVFNEDGSVVAKMKGPFSKVFDSIPSVKGDESFAELKTELGAKKDALAEILAKPAGEDRDAEQTAAEEAIAAAGQAVEAKRQALGEAFPTDRDLSAMIANRDNDQLASALAPLAGDFVAQRVFGVGVVGMALSTIIILMLINGFAICELFNAPDSKFLYLLGCVIAGAGGIAGPFIWGNADAKAALAIPTSVIGGALIPIAYVTFFLMMNSRRVLGDSMPTGIRWFVGNVLMMIATGIATFASVWGLWGKAGSSKPWEAYFGMGGLAMLAILLVLGTLGFLAKNTAASWDD